MYRPLSFILTIVMAALMACTVGCGMPASSPSSSSSIRIPPKTATASAAMYPAPSDAPISSLYTVSVTDGGTTTSSPVYYSVPRAGATNGGDRYLSWGTSFSYTTFSVSEPVTVTVTKLSGSFTAAVIRPNNYGITPTITSSNTLTFPMIQGQKASVELDNDLNDRLMIFADVVEDPANVPTPGASGVYSVSTSVSPSTAGTPFTVPSGDTIVYFGPGLYDLGWWVIPSTVTQVYIAGGAFVEGSLYAGAINNLMINGRGILSGVNFSYQQCETPPGGSSCTPMGLIHLDGGSGDTIEGITLTNSPTDNIPGAQPNATFDNIKIVGNWQTTNGGIPVGNNDTVKNCFINAMDDTFTMYRPNATIYNCVIWQGFNGAVFQYGWGIRKNDTNNTVSDINVIHADWRGGGGENDALFSYVHGPGPGDSTSGTISDQTFNFITVDTPIYSVFSIDLPPGQTMTGININNLVVDCLTTDSTVTKSCETPAPQTCPNSVSVANCFDNDSSNPVTPSDWTISKEYLGGQLITSANAASAADMVIGSGVDITFNDGTNVLDNPGFESSTVSPWTSFNGATIQLVTTPVHSGTQSLETTGRSEVASGPSQDVTAALLLEGQTTYTLGASLKLATGSDTMHITLEIIDSAGTHAYVISCAANSTSFTSCSNTRAVTWSGNLSQAIFHVASTTSLANFYTDDTILQ